MSTWQLSGQQTCCPLLRERSYEMECNFDREMPVATETLGAAGAKQGRIAASHHGRQSAREDCTIPWTEVPAVHVCRALRNGKPLISLGLALGMLVLVLSVLGAVPRRESANQLLGTSFGGVITESTTWDLAGSPYTLTQDVTVASGVTLTIEPGVTVRGQATTELLVLGHLRAVGTRAQPITFTSASDSGPNQWAGLVFNGGTGHLRHATARYAGYGNSVRQGNIVARDVVSGQVLIENSQILTGTTPSLGSRSYGLYIDNSHVAVSHTLISGIGDASDDYAIYATGSGTVMTITNSTLRENSGYGIRVHSGQATVNCTTITNNPGGGIWVTGGGLSAIGSDISSNVEFGLQNDSGARVDARYNWWGGTDGPYHPTHNSGGLAESEVSDDVDFIPWLEVATCSPLIDLSVAKSGLPNPALVGSALTYTINITNKGFEL